MFCKAVEILWGSHILLNRWRNGYETYPMVAIKVQSIFKNYKKF